MIQTYILEPQYDTRTSFYNKARVKIDTENNIKTLFSYETKVSYIKNGIAIVLGSFSTTTTRHIKEFLKQNGFKVESTKQILNDYKIFICDKCETEYITEQDLKNCECNCY